MAWGTLLVLYRFSTHKFLRLLFGVLTAVFCFGLGWGMSETTLHRTDFDYSDQTKVYRATVVAKAEPKKKSTACRVEIGANKFMLYLPADSSALALRRGDELLVYVRLTPPQSYADFDYRRYLFRRGYSGTGYVTAWQPVGHADGFDLQQSAAACRERIV
ncbi:MAG: DUF4131 domain-containing protein, partial [Mediterranea sp.]|nr:DUF4131 domain-containing protein [Mediterranea sp.]